MFGRGRFPNRPYNGLILHGFPLQLRNSYPIDHISLGYRMIFSGTSSFDVGTSSFDVGTSSFNVGTSSFDVGTSSFDVGTSSFDVGTSLHVRYRMMYTQRIVHRRPAIGQVAQWVPKTPVFAPIQARESLREKTCDLIAPLGVKGAKLPCGAWGETPQNPSNKSYEIRP